MTRKMGMPDGNILVVSRDNEFLSSLRYILRDRDYQVNTCETAGYGVMEVVNEISPDLAIVDIAMPLMTGIATVLRIRINTAISTILLTNWRVPRNTFRRLDAYDSSGLSTLIRSDELVEWVDAVMIGICRQAYSENMN